MCIEPILARLLHKPEPSELCRAFYDREPAITIRQYAPYLVAEVTVEGNKNMEEAISDGFRQASLHQEHS
jgi:hypothetical protein